jgi:hypothetical protein
MTTNKTIGINGKKIELNEKTCNDLLKIYIDKAYKSTGSFSIQDGAKLHQYFRILSGDEEDNSVDKKTIYQTFCKTLEHSNTKGCFGLDDAAVIFTLVEYINSSILTEEKVV